MTKHERAMQAAYQAAGITDDEARRAIAAYLAVMRQPAEGEVRVRACVAVNATDDGEPRWVLSGRYGEPDDEVVCWVAGDSGGEQERDQLHWLEANVPAWRPPAEETVEGEVVG